MNLVQQLSGSEYIRYVVKGVPSLKAWFLGGKVFIVLILLCFFIIRKKYKSHLNTVFVIGVFVNLIPTSIQSFQHYFINTFPYIFLLLAYNWEDAYRKRAFLVISVGALLISSLLFLRVIRYKGEYNHQLLIANSLQKCFPKNSTVFVYGKERYLYFLNNYDNPLKEKIGYSYLNNLPPYFLEGLKVISNKPFSDMKELFVLKKQKLYLKL
ncbi:hypothetical protein GUB10_02715 [Salegentibacter sp. BLCTC]|uniref:hypothetical protein n=1 Tax=Salegentibacter sp. BLCTC TaxID=2697368 RepID=UPI00187BAA4F|nr:hypothetical protein [Salegentibacter sp. BLCTC]MBE7639234.1 hypothetical protein [Salegentibacter sp. BLCTC]